jgi:23S rRNA (guanosine2251-2'-O)-methyltransferase
MRSIIEDNEEICRGRKPVTDLLTNNPSRCAKLLIANNVRPPFLDEIVDLARAAKVTYQLVAPEALDKLSGGEKHQGVICKLNFSKQVDIEDFLRELGDTSRALVVILDHIEDPHNLGAVIRSAEAGGASAVIHAKRRSAIPNGTVIKTSAGASLRLPVIQVVNISRTIERLKESGFWAVGLSEKSERSIWDEKLPERCALVVGAEGTGLSRLVCDMCDMISRIPIKGGVGSLNASVAAALGIFEWSRNNISGGS